MNEEIVSVEWLKNNLEKEDLIILDASPKQTVHGTTSSIGEKSIPHARIFDIKGNFTDKNNKFPNTIPSPIQFEKGCQALGINSNSEIVVYDNLGIYTSPRVWWLFKTMGHNNVKVLNWGLIEWIKQGYETTKKSTLEPVYGGGNFQSKFKPQNVINYNEIKENINSEKFLVLDARSEGRFKGISNEPRKHLKSGSIPGSINIPYGSLLENGKFKSRDELVKMFNNKVGDEKQLVFSCGSGMTACIVMLGGHLANRKCNYLYDGSWSEYAELEKLIY